MQLSTSEELHYFKKQIPDKMRRPPFSYTEQKVDEFYVRHFFLDFSHSMLDFDIFPRTGFAVFSVFARFGLFIRLSPEQNFGKRRQYLGWTIDYRFFQRNAISGYEYFFLLRVCQGEN